MPARSLTTAGVAAASARSTSSRCSRSGGTRAWEAKTSGASGAAGAAAASTPSPTSGRNGSRASPKPSAGATSAATARNSCRSRWLCTTNRSQARRSSTAFGEAGMLMPGSPVSSTGRRGPRSSGSRVSVCTTGPVQASSTTSGRSRTSRLSSAGRARVRTPARSPATWSAAAIWDADGITALRSSTEVLVQSGGRLARVAALHLR